MAVIGREETEAVLARQGDLVERDHGAAPVGAGRRVR